MKKLTLSIGLLAGILSANAQDTLCLMVKQKEILEFNYYTSEILNRMNWKGAVYYNIKGKDVLCLHLYDKQNKVRKVIINGKEEILNSKSTLYYISGPAKIAIGKSKYFIEL